MIETIQHQQSILSIIIRAQYNQPGISFFTPDAFSQQLAFMRHPKGKVITPHIHNEVHRSVRLTQEVLVIRKGKLRVDFYDEQQHYLESRILLAGDLILLASGGHGFEVLEPLEMFEIKQGPYLKDKDKTRFQGVAASAIKVTEYEYSGE